MKTKEPALFSAEVDRATSLDRDHLYRTFQGNYQALFEIPYRPTKGDWVQLARLMRAVPIGTLDEIWSPAVLNYLTSPMGRYTLADLCSRVEVFAKGRLDRYGKPVEAKVDTNKAVLQDWASK